MRIAFFKTGNEVGINRHVLSLLRHWEKKGAEVREFDLRAEDMQSLVNEMVEFSPAFSMDLNSTGVIVGHQENKKLPISDIFGFVHVSIFTDDPLLYFPPLSDIRQANNYLPVVCDLKYVDSLKFLGIEKGIFYVTPFVDKESMIEPSGEKDIELLFLGPVVDPQIVIDQVSRNIPQNILPIFFEMGEFMFRNPEVPVLKAYDYILSMFNQSFQEELERWKLEKPEDFYRLLNDTAMYATSRKRLYLLSFLEGINLKLVGEFQCELVDGHERIEVSSQEEFLKVLDRSYMAVLSFPFSTPSGIGFTPLEVAYMGCAPMLDLRATLQSFLSPGSECVAYYPIDRADIEEKVLYYLDHLNEALEIGKQARDKVLEKFNSEDRAIFLWDVFNQILEQAQTRDKNS
ncbi:MAG: glycosyltransferase [Aquificaceae bacterium]